MRGVRYLPGTGSGCPVFPIRRAAGRGPAVRRPNVSGSVFRGGASKADRKGVGESSWGATNPFSYIPHIFSHPFSTSHFRPSFLNRLRLLGPLKVPSPFCLPGPLPLLAIPIPPTRHSNHSCPSVRFSRSHSALSGLNVRSRVRIPFMVPS